MGIATQLSVQMRTFPDTNRARTGVGRIRHDMSREADGIFLETNVVLDPDSGALYPAGIQEKRGRFLQSLKAPQKNTAGLT